MLYRATGACPGTTRRRRAPASSKPRKAALLSPRKRLRRPPPALGRHRRACRRGRAGGDRRAAGADRAARSTRCSPRPRWSPRSSDAADALKASLSPRAFKPFLLEGVTGSGKTEVYFEAIAQALEAGGQALVMMPEIALTTQFLERFADRFGEKPAEWHSGVGARKRARIWRGCATGEVRRGRRRALGAVPALSRSAADRRR